MQRVSGNKSGAGASARSASVATSAGVIYTVTRLLGSASTLALLAGSNGNLTLNTTTGAISAAAAIAAAASQTALVRESSGQLAVEYPVTLTGASPVVTPTPAASGSALTIDSIVTGSGNVYTFTARRTANIANAENRAITVAGSTSYSPAATAADFGGTFPSPVAAFAAGASTAQFQVTSAVAQPE